MVTLADIGEFLQSVLFAYDDYLMMSFVIMVTFAIAMGIRKLFIWGS